MKRIRQFFYALRIRIFHGPVTFKTMDTMDAWGSQLVTEYEAFNRHGKGIGYWAYGSWDPAGIYRGEHPYWSKPFPDESAIDGPAQTQ